MAKKITDCFFVLAALVACLQPLVCVAAPLQEEIPIGAIYSLTGFGALAGKSELNAVQMAIEEINSRGGIKGRPLRLIAEDNRSSLKDTVSVFNKLVSYEGVKVILGPNWAEFAEIAAPLAQKKKVVMLTASAYSKTFFQNRDYVFTIYPEFKVQITPLLDHLLSKHQDEHFAAIRSQNTYFEGIYEVLVDGLEKQRVKVVIKESAVPGETDFRSFILKLKKQKIGAVIAFLVEGGSIVSFLRQVRQQNYRGKIFSYDLSYDEAILDDITIAEGVVHFKYHVDIPEELASRYRRKFKMEPILNVPFAYDSMHLIADVLKRCGLESKKIRDCLASSRYRGVSEEISFDSQGKPLSPRSVSKLYKIVNGKFKPYNP